jgi:glycosyltransferase involved in cell wall biosynthesis
VTTFAGLRVALVGPLPPPAGGMAGQTQQLAGLLAQAGAHVTLVQTNAAYRPRWVARVPMLRALFRLLPYLGQLWRVAGRSDLCHVMANSGWSWHLFAAPAVCLARLRSVPVVVNYRGGEAQSFLERAHASVRRTLGAGTLLAVPSGFLQRVFAGFGMVAEVVPNIVDTARFCPAPPPRRRTAHIVVARNLEPIYDNKTALRAFALVLARRPDARLTIAGSGPEEGELRALARQLEVAPAVRFAGRLDRDAMAALYREADIALNPSTVDNMPNSVLEAMASGLPVISTDVGGVPYIVQDGTTALLVPPGDAQSMAAAVARLLDNPSLADSLVSAGLCEVQRYTWARASGALDAVYARALSARATS